VERSEIGRKLAALRPTVETTCQVCGTVFVGRARKQREGQALQPLARYCSADCRSKAHYEANKAARLEYQRRRRGENKLADRSDTDG
jgi:hypothetical protein